MRVLKLAGLFALFLCCGYVSAQVPTPQLNLTGNIGCIGFPCLNSGTYQMPSDANVTFSGSNVNTSGISIKITSAVSLTATRSIIYPAGRFLLNVENATTGGQAIVIIGPSGTGVTIGNGQAATVWNDGTNYVQMGVASAGTVTHTSGALTVNQVVIGNGGGDITVGPGCTYSGSGLTCQGFFGSNFSATGGSGVAGAFLSTEGTAPGGVSGLDLLYGDASTHRFRMTMNAGSVLFAVGLNAAAPAGDCAKFATNGYDVTDSGSACGGGANIAHTLNVIAGDNTGNGIATSITATTSTTSHGITLPASSAPITPVSANVIYESDSSGNGVISENGAAASRVCTAANGQCATSSAFSAITSGTNTAAAMVVGSGASLAPSGTGSIKATNIGGTVAAGAGISITGAGTTASPYTFGAGTSSTTYLLVSQLGCAAQNSNLNTGGGTDDTACINAALATATASHPVLLIQDGVSLIHGIAGPAAGNWGIEGLGGGLIGSGLYGTGFYLANSSTVDAISNSVVPSAGVCEATAGTVPSRGANVLLKDFALNGNSANNSSVYCFGIDIQNMNGVSIDNVTVYNVYHYQSHFTNIGQSIIRGSTFVGSGNIYGDGIHISGPADDVAISDDYIQTGDDAIALNAPEGYCGVIQRVTITNVNVFNSLRLLRAYTNSATCSNSALAQVSSVSITNLSGTATANWAIFGNLASFGTPPPNNNSITDITWTNSIVSSPLGAFIGDTVGYMNLSNIAWEGSTTAGAFIYTTPEWSTANIVGSLVLNNDSIVRTPAGNLGAGAVDFTSGFLTMTNLTINGFSVRNVGGSYSATPLLIVYGGATVASCSISNIDPTNITAIEGSSTVCTTYEPLWQGPENIRSSGTSYEANYGNLTYQRNLWGGNTSAANAIGFGPAQNSPNLVVGYMGSGNTTLGTTFQGKSFMASLLSTDLALTANTGLPPLVISNADNSLNAAAGLTLKSTTTTASLPILQLTNNSVVNGNFALVGTESSLNTGQYIGVMLGHDASNYNEGYFRFLYTGNNSTSNCMSLGLFNADDLLKICGTGNAIFSGGATAANLTDSALTTGLVGNTSGLLGTITALPSGTTATTQASSDNSTKVATTAYVQANLSATYQPRYWNVQGVLFATSTVLGPVYYANFASNSSQLAARLSGTISCTVAPVVVLLDLGTSVTTAYGSATVLASLTTGTSDGAYVTAVGGGSITAGHYYGIGFSGGTCVTAPTFDITTQW